MQLRVALQQIHRRTLHSVRAALPEAAEAAAEVFAAAVRARAPRLSGELAESVQQQGNQVIVDAPHAAWVEYGHRAGRRLQRRHDRPPKADRRRKVKPHPFLRPAFDEARPAAEAAAEKVLADAIARELQANIWRAINATYEQGLMNS